MSISVMEPETTEDKNDLVALKRELQITREKSKYIALELDLFRQRRAISLSDRFRNTFDAWNLMNKGFQRLKDDTAIFFGGIAGFRLQPSVSMLRVPFLSYKVDLRTKNLSGILLAPVVEVPTAHGEICLQVLGESQQLLAQASTSVATIKDDAPTALIFPPIANSDKQVLTIKVFAQGVDVPVRLFEMRRYKWGGFGELETRSFAAFIFAE